MRSFYVLSEQIVDDKVIISGQDAKHLAKVLRLQAGERVKVLDGSGKAYLVNLLTVGQSEVIGMIEKVEDHLDMESPIKVNLIQGLPKQGKMELIVQKCTELGVHAIYPVETERTVVKLADNKGRDKADRWQKVAVEAVKQCGRSKVPQIAEPRSLKALLRNLPQDKPLLLLWEGERTQGLKKQLTDWIESRRIPEELFVLIGPEGGFSQDEVSFIQQQGGQTVTIGPRILRTETAGMAVLTMILYQLGDLGG